MKFRFWYIEAFLVVLFLVLTFSSLSNPTLENPDFVPNAVNGLATMSGIMTAFTGYLLTYLIPRIPDTPKAWISKRIIAVLISMIVGLLSVILGLSELVFGSLKESYNSALYGTFLIFVASFEVFFMVLFKETEQTTNLSDTFQT